MNSKNSDKKSGKRLSVRLPDDVNEEFLAIVNGTGHTETAVIEEALRIALPQLREEFILERDQSMATLKKRPKPSFERKLQRKSRPLPRDLKD